MYQKIPVHTTQVPTMLTSKVVCLLGTDAVKSRISLFITHGGMNSGPTPILPRANVADHYASQDTHKMPN